MIERSVEERLLAGLRGEREERQRALQELFELTREPLFALTLRMTGRPDLADDAVQETCVNVLRHVEGFRGDARLTTWLYRVAVRAAVTVSARAKARGAAAALPDELAADGDEPREALAQREGAARLLAAIAKLPAPERAVLALTALQDLSRDEVAAVLGVPVGTVDSRLHRARGRLREALARGS